MRWNLQKPRLSLTQWVHSCCRRSCWRRSITASPCWCSGSRWSRESCTRCSAREKTRWTSVKMWRYKDEWTIMSCNVIIRQRTRRATYQLWTRCRVFWRLNSFAQGDDEKMLHSSICRAHLRVVGFVSASVWTRSAIKNEYFSFSKKERKWRDSTAVAL